MSHHPHGTARRFSLTVLPLVFCCALGLLPMLSPESLAADEPVAETDSDRAQEGTHLPPGLEIEVDGKMILDRDGVSRFTGPVTITWRGSRIQADSMVLREQRYLEGEGNILIAWDGNWISGHSLTYDLETERGIIEDSIGRGKNEFLFWADSAEKIGPNTIRLHDATVTSCTQPQPYWSFRVSTATITLDQYARMWNARLKANRLAVFYMPYLVWPVKKDRAAGVLFPEFGSTSARGNMINQELFIPLGRSADLTLLGRYYTKAGLGGGAELRFIPNSKGSATLSGFYIKDKVAVNTPSDRYTASYRQTQQFANGFRMLANINVISDFNFYSDFAKDLQLVSSPSILTRLEFSRNGPWTSINIREQRREQLFSNGDSLIQESIPEIEWRGRSRQLGGTPLYLTYESSLAWIKQRTKVSTGGYDDISNYYRGDVYPSLTMQLSKLPWLDITPGVSYRLTYYTQHRQQVIENVGGDIVTSHVISDDSLTRTMWRGGVEITGPKLVKIYERPNSHYSPLYKHLIEPKITYGYQETFERFDDVIIYDEVDRFNGAGNLLRYSLVQRLFAKRPRSSPSKAGDSELQPAVDTLTTGDTEEPSIYETPQELLEPELDSSKLEAVEIATFELSQSRSFDRDQTDADLDGDGIREEASPYSNVQLLGRYNPSRSTSLDLRGTYDILFDEFSDVSLSGSYRNWLTRVRFSLIHLNGLGVTPDPANPGMFLGLENNTQLRFSAGLNLLGGKLRIDLDSSINFDPLDGNPTIPHRRARVIYSTQCCSFLVEQLVRTLGTGTDRDDLYFRVDFKGIGKIVKFSQ
jgi:hypothetical protein